MKETLIVNFFGAPGVGKSTLAAAVFVKMKRMGLSVEYVSEFAKEKVWESNLKALECQPYITGTQLFYLQRIIGQVDYIINDSPIVLGAVYNKDYPASYNNFLVDVHNSMNTLNFMLHIQDGRQYEQTGRRHAEKEAVKIESKIISLLNNSPIVYSSVNQYKVTEEELIKMIQESKNV